MGSNAGGFDFELVKRNAMLQSKGVTPPKAWKTGTTIAGVVFKVQQDPHCGITSWPTFMHAAHVGRVISDKCLRTSISQHKLAATASTSIISGCAVAKSMAHHLASPLQMPTHLQGGVVAVMPAHKQQIT